MTVLSDMCKRFPTKDYGFNQECSKYLKDVQKIQENLNTDFSKLDPQATKQFEEKIKSLVSFCNTKFPTPPEKVKNELLSFAMLALKGLLNDMNQQLAAIPKLPVQWQQAKGSF